MWATFVEADGRFLSVYPLTRSHAVSIKEEIDLISPTRICFKKIASCRSQKEDD
jgi:hypothetical protein